MRKLAPAARMTLAAAVVLSVLIPLAVAEGAAPSPWVGTWVLDAAHSKIAPNRPTSVTLIFTQADAALIRYSLHFSTAQGQSIVSNYEGKPDGKPHPAVINGKEVAQAAYNWTSPKILHGVVTSPNGPPEDLQMKMSADGKTITEIRKKGASEETLVLQKKP